MKTIGKIMFALTLTGLPFGEGLFGQETANQYTFPVVSAQTSAQAPARAADGDTDLFALGYCVNTFANQEGFGWKRDDTQQHTLNAAIYLPASLLKKYEGDKIEYIDFGLAQKFGTSATVFVTEELTGRPLSTGTTTSHEKGWNRVKLAAPVTVTGNKDLYVGVSVLFGADENGQGLAYDNVANGVAGRNWYGIDSQWFKLAVNAVPYNFCVRAILSGDNVPESDISVVEVAVDNAYKEQNQPWTATLTVRNNGSKPVTSLDVQASVGGKIMCETSSDDDFEIAPGEMGKVSVPGVKVSSEGDCEVTLTVTKANGVDDSDLSDNSINTTIYSYREGTEPGVPNILFEQFISEYYNEAMKADSLYGTVADRRNDIVWVKHHMVYRNTPDQFVNAEEEPYLELFSDGTKFVPAVCANRLPFSGQEDAGPAYFVADGESLEGIINGALSVPSFVNLSVTATPSADGRSVHADITGHAGTRSMQQQTDLRLTTWLVEDSIESDEQSGIEVYVQNGVLRRVVSSDAWGDKLDISNYDFSQSFDIPLEPSWNAKNMRVVAFVNNYNDSPYRRIVYNSAQGYCTPRTAIDNIASGKRAARAAYVAGRVVGSEGYEVSGVFDVSGRQVSDRSLKPGVYVVRLTDGHRTVSQKLSIAR